MRRDRNAKIIATLGPSSNTRETMECLFMAGADIFRLNFSHGVHADHEEKVHIIREFERKFNRPIGIIADLQGPKLRIGVFEGGRIMLKKGHQFRLDLNTTHGNFERVNLPHPEIFHALEVGAELLLDDGKLKLKVLSFQHDHAITEVICGGELSNRKGLNVPGVMLPISALTPKDHVDLDFALGLGVDFIALSFVQRVEDVVEAKEIIKGRAKILAKLEKPMALMNLGDIIDSADGIMVARGDLGVEMLPEDVPSVQRKIIRGCRSAGKPVIVATQMLESMMIASTPTRAEASDVATAIYDGVDAVMLSGESASGQYPVEAVDMMDRIIRRTEQDPLHRKFLNESHSAAPETVTDSIAEAARQVAQTIDVGAIVTFSESGTTSLRVARQRPSSPIIALTPNLGTSRLLTLVWGVHPVVVEDVYSFSHMVEIACRAARSEQFAEIQQNIIVTAGIPFGESGGTNILRIARIEESVIEL
ncbi:MAG: pyruvate kinase [Candidatus Paracaedibacteraceae bacterium]|nr:pyruvate kinase [Candidatus Paracaedibacteraceae bacterium]